MLLLSFCPSARVREFASYFFLGGGGTSAKPRKYLSGFLKRNNNFFKLYRTLRISYNFDNVRHGVFSAGKCRAASGMGGGPPLPSPPLLPPGGRTEQDPRRRSEITAVHSAHCDR